MFPWDWRERIARETEGAGGGGGAAPPGGGSGSDTAAGGADTPAGGGADPGNLFDVAEQQEPQRGADGKLVKPADLPDQFWNGEKGEIRVDALAKSWRDLRAQVSKGPEKPPENADAYQLPKVEGLPDGFIGGKDDTLWLTVRQAAHKAGVSQRQLEALAAPFLSAVAEQMKAADPQQSEEDRRQAAEKEIGTLGPNGRQLVADVGGWLRGMVSTGRFTQDEALALRGVSTAAGVRALAKLRELTGEKPIPTDAMQADQATQADLQRMLTESYAKNDPELRRKALAGLAELEKRGALA